VNVVLFGYPGTGKTTLFRLLTGAEAGAGARGEARREPNVRARALPDERLDVIASLYPEKKKVPVAAEFTDLAGGSFGEVKDGVFFDRLRKADGMVHVVRGFQTASLPHPKGRISPPDDIRFMEEELVLADLAAAQARLERLEKDLKKMKDPEAEKERDLLVRLAAFLGEGKSLRAFPFPLGEEKLVRSFSFLSLKPLLHMINVDEKNIAVAGGSEGGNVLTFCGSIECEIQELAEEEKESFRAGYGLGEPGTAKFFRELPGFLGILTFYTVGKDEVRAWPLRKGASAVTAAGAIHSDIEKGFIRAEVIAWDELVRRGSLQNARDAGAVRLEGKNYVVRDGDVVYFRFAQ
jgi:GTP-binding protein YchF